MVFNVAEAGTSKHGHAGNVRAEAKLDVQRIPRARLGAFGNTGDVFTGMALCRLIGNTRKHFEYVHDDEPHRASDCGVGSVPRAEYVARGVHAQITYRGTTHNDHGRRTAGTRRRRVEAVIGFINSL